MSNFCVLSLSAGQIEYGCVVQNFYQFRHVNFATHKFRSIEQRFISVSVKLFSTPVLYVFPIEAKCWIHLATQILFVKTLPSFSPAFTVWIVSFVYLNTLTFSFSFPKPTRKRLHAFTSTGRLFSLLSSLFRALCWTACWSSERNCEVFATIRTAVSYFGFRCTVLFGDIIKPISVWGSWKIGTPNAIKCLCWKCLLFLQKQTPQKQQDFEQNHEGKNYKLLSRKESLFLI